MTFRNLTNLTNDIDVIHVFIRLPLQYQLSSLLNLDVADLDVAGVYSFLTHQKIQI